jgi:hypothetical protein
MHAVVMCAKVSIFEAVFGKPAASTMIIEVDPRTVIAHLDNEVKYGDEHLVPGVAFLGGSPQPRLYIVEEQAAELMGGSITGPDRSFVVIGNHPSYPCTYLSPHPLNGRVQTHRWDGIWLVWVRLSTVVSITRTATTRSSAWDGVRIGVHGVLRVGRIVTDKSPHVPGALPTARSASLHWLAGQLTHQLGPARAGLPLVTWDKSKLVRTFFERVYHGTATSEVCVPHEVRLFPCLRPQLGVGYLTFASLTGGWMCSCAGQVCVAHLLRAWTSPQLLLGQRLLDVVQALDT